MEDSMYGGFKHIPTRFCKPEDFHLDKHTEGEEYEQELKNSLSETEADVDGEPFFFPPNKSHINFMRQYHPKMHCFKDKKVQLSGNYDTAKAMTLAIVFEMCNPKERSTCKSETEIYEWIKGKYIITIENSWVFRSNKFNERRMTAESNFHWFPLSSIMKVETSRMMTVGEIAFQDNLLQIGQMTQEDVSYFRLEKNVDRPFEMTEGLHFMIRYEMSMHKQVIERVVYGLLDLLGDIGGF